MGDEMLLQVDADGQTCPGRLAGSLCCSTPTPAMSRTPCAGRYFTFLHRLWTTPLQPHAMIRHSNSFLEMSGRNLLDTQRKAVLMVMSLTHVEACPWCVRVLSTDHRCMFSCLRQGCLSCRSRGSVPAGMPEEAKACLRFNAWWVV